MSERKVHSSSSCECASLGRRYRNTKKNDASEIAVEAKKPLELIRFDKNGCNGNKMKKDEGKKKRRK
jgi:hypothetical protein